jgi:heptosyltransferase I
MGQGVDLLGSLTRIVPERAPAPIDGSRLERLLIVKLSSIGDVVHALPTASAIRRAFPAIRITWAIEEWTAPLVIDHPAVDRVVVFPAMPKRPSSSVQWARRFAAAVRELRGEPYDLCLDLQGLARSAALALLSRSPRRIARSGQREGAHLVSSGVALDATAVHAVDECLQLARWIGAAIDPVSFSLPVQRPAAAAVDRLLAARDVAPDRPLVVVNPSSAARWKNWPASQWVAVIDALADCGGIVLIGTAAQVSAHAAIAEAAACPPIDLTGQTTLAEVIALIDRAALHLAPDSGTVHIADALGTPVVAVYGPSRPSRLGPYHQPANVVYHGELCGHGCPAYCARGRRCLAAATPAEVIAKARAAVGSGRRSHQSSVTSLQSQSSVSVVSLQSSRASSFCPAHNDRRIIRDSD